MPAGWLNSWDSPSLQIFESVIAAAPMAGPGACAVETFAFDDGEPGKIAETLGRVGGYDESEIREGLALLAGDTVPIGPSMYSAAPHPLLRSYAAGPWPGRATGSRGGRGCYSTGRIGQFGRELEAAATRQRAP